MQFRDLGAQYLALKDDIDEQIRQTIEGSRYILGPAVGQLEAALAQYVGVKHCISCANGTDALILCLKAWGIGEGDAVFVPDFTFFATANCAMNVGAEPVLVDIDPVTFNMSPAALEAAIEKTLQEGKLAPKVIIPVDLFGLCADYSAIEAIAKRYDLLVLEDGAQGFGGQIENRMACSFGDIAITSFFPAKPLGCYGDGGAIFTNSDEMAQKLISIRSQGRSLEDKYDNLDIGLNSRLDTLQAGILLAKFKAFAPFELDRVNEIAQGYTDALKDLVCTPSIPEGYRSSWAQYTILLKSAQQRDALHGYLKQHGIPSMIYYSKGLHDQVAIRKHTQQSNVFPNTDACAKTCLSIPIHAYLTEDEQQQVIDCIREFINTEGERL